MKQYLFILILLINPYLAKADAVREITSPDHSVRLLVDVSNRLTYSVYYKSQALVSPSEIDMILSDGRKLSDGLASPAFSQRNNKSVIISPVPEKRKRIPDEYNELTITLPNSFGVIFKVYNDGVAYRIVTSFKEAIQVRDEVAEFHFPTNHPVYFPKVVPDSKMDKYHTSFEELYTVQAIDSISANDLFFTPVLVASEKVPKVAITESDLEDYPGMFLVGTMSNALRGNFAPYPAEETESKELYSLRYVTKRADFISKTKGSRAFPWRVLMIAPQDKDLPANDLVYRLASPSRVADVSWVKPGKATDEWIITSNIFNVPFKSGINTET